MPDGSSIIGYIISFLLLIMGSAFFSASEMSISSVNRIHMITAADNGDRKAKRVLYIIENYEQALTVLLIGNNIVNIGCATLATVLAAQVAAGSTGVGESVAITVSTIITTVVILFMGEIIPKCYAKSCNEKFAMNVSAILIFLMKVLKPLSLAFTAFSNVVTKPFLKNVKEAPTVTEDELYEIVDSIVENENDFDEDTATLVQSAIKYSGKTVEDILIPWDEVLKIKSNMKTAEILEVVKDSNHSRLPVVGRDGKLKGILRIRSFLKAYIRGRKNVVLASVMDRPFYAEAQMPIDDMLERLSSHKRNLAVVRDDDDNILGIVTVEDILETLVGKIYDEDDHKEDETNDC